MRASVDAEIIGTEIEAEYQGSIYERTVKINAGSTILEVFEGTNIITDDDTGSTVGLELCARLIRDVERVSTTELGIYQAPNRDSKWSVTIICRIVETGVHPAFEDRDTPMVFTDIGTGSILLESTPELLERVDRDWNVNEDVIRVHCGRIDVIGRH